MPNDKNIRNNSWGGLVQGAVDDMMTGRRPLVHSNAELDPLFKEDYIPENQEALDRPFDDPTIDIAMIANATGSLPEQDEINPGASILGHELEQAGIAIQRFKRNKEVILRDLEIKKKKIADTLRYDPEDKRDDDQVLKDEGMDVIADEYEKIVQKLQAGDELINKVQNINDPFLRQVASYYLANGKYDAARNIAEADNVMFEESKKTGEKYSIMDIPLLDEKKRRTLDNAKELTIGYINTKKTEAERQLAEIDKLLEEYNKKNTGQNIAYGMFVPDSPETDAIVGKLLSAQRIIKEEKDLYDTFLQKSSKSKLWDGIAKHSADLVSIGFSSLIHNLSVLNSSLKSPDEWNDGDKMLLTAYGRYVNSQIAVNDASMRAYRWGDMVGGSLVFAENMLVTGGIGGEIEAGASTAVKAAAKSLAKKEAKKVAVNKIANILWKGTVKAAKMTPFQTATYTQAINHRLKGFQYQRATDGSIEIIGANEEARLRQLKAVDREIQKITGELEKLTLTEMAGAMSGQEGVMPAEQEARAMELRANLNELLEMKSKLVDAKGKPLTDPNLIQSLAFGASQQFRELLTEGAGGLLIEKATGRVLSGAGKLLRKYRPTRRLALRYELGIKTPIAKAWYSTKSYIPAALTQAKAPWFWQGWYNEMLEEGLNNFLPAYGEDYMDNVKQTFTKEFWTDVGVTIALQSPMMGGFGAMVNIAKGAFDTDHRKALEAYNRMMGNYYAQLRLLTKHGDKDVMRLYNSVSLESKIPLVRIINELDKEEKYHDHKDVVRRAAVMNGYLNAIAIGEEDKYMELLQELAARGKLGKEYMDVMAKLKKHRAIREAMGRREDFDDIMRFYYSVERKGVLIDKLASFIDKFEKDNKDHWEQFKEKHAKAIFTDFSDFLNKYTSWKIGYGVFTNEEVAAFKDAEANYAFDDAAYMAMLQRDITEDANRMIEEHMRRMAKEMKDSVKDTTEEKKQEETTDKKDVEKPIKEDQTKPDDAAEQKKPEGPVDDSGDVIADEGVDTDVYDKSVALDLKVKDIKVTGRKAMVRSGELSPSGRPAYKVRKGAKAIDIPGLKKGAFSIAKDEESGDFVIVNVFGDEVARGKTEKKAIANLVKEARAGNKRVTMMTEKQIKKGNPVLKKKKTDDKPDAGGDVIDLLPAAKSGRIVLVNAVVAKIKAGQIKGEYSLIDTVLQEYASKIEEAEGDEAELEKVLEEIATVIIQVADIVNEHTEYNLDYGLIDEIFFDELGNILLDELTKKEYNKIMERAKKINEARAVSEPVATADTDTPPAKKAFDNAIEDVKAVEEKTAAPEQEGGKITYRHNDHGFRGSDPKILTFDKDVEDDVLAYDKLVAGSPVRLRVDTEYLEDPDNKITLYDTGGKKNVVTVRKFARILGYKSYEEFIEAVRNSNTSGILENELFIHYMPVRVQVAENGVWKDTRLHIHSTGYYNTENAALPYRNGVPDYNLRQENAERAYMHTYLLRKAIAQNGGYAQTEVKAREFGAIRYLRATESSNYGKLNTYKDIFGGDFELLKKRIQFLYFKQGDQLVSDKTTEPDKVIGSDGKAYGLDRIVNYAEIISAYAKVIAEKADSLNGFEGLSMLVVETGKDKNGEPVFVAFFVVGTHPNLEKRYQQMNTIAAVLSSSDKIRSRQTELGELAALLGDVARYAPRMMSGVYKLSPNDAMAGQEVIDLGALADMIDFSKDVEEQLLRLVEEGNIPTTTYEEYLLKNIHFPFETKQVQTKAGESYYTVEKEPHITLWPLRPNLGASEEEMHGSPLKALSNTGDKDGEALRAAVASRLAAEVGQELAMQAMTKLATLPGLSLRQLLEVSKKLYTDLKEKIRSEAEKEQDKKLKKVYEIAVGLLDDEDFVKDIFSKDGAVMQAVSTYFGMSLARLKEMGGVSGIISQDWSDKLMKGENLSFDVLRVLAGIRNKLMEDSEIVQDRFTKQADFVSSDDIYNAVYQIGSRMDDNNWPEFVEKAKELAKEQPYRYGFVEEMIERIEKLGSLRFTNELAYKAYMYKYRMTFLSVSKNKVNVMDMTTTSPERTAVNLLTNTITRASILNRFRARFFTVDGDKVRRLRSIIPEIEKAYLENGKIRYDLIRKALIQLGLPLTVEQLRVMFEYDPKNFVDFFVMRNSKVLSVVVDEFEKMSEAKNTMYYVEREFGGPKILKYKDTNFKLKYFNPWLGSLAIKSVTDDLIDMIAKAVKGDSVTLVRKDKQALAYQRPTIVTKTLQLIKSGKYKRDSVTRINRVLDTFTGEDDDLELAYAGLYAMRMKGKLIEVNEMADWQVYLHDIHLFFEDVVKYFGMKSRYKGYVKLPTSTDNKNMQYLKVPIHTEFEAALDAAVEGTVFKDLARVAAYMLSNEKIKEPDIDAAMRLIMSIPGLNIENVTYGGKQMPLIRAFHAAVEAEKEKLKTTKDIDKFVRDFIKQHKLRDTLHNMMRQEAAIIAKTIKDSGAAIKEYPEVLKQMYEGGLEDVVYIYVANQWAYKSSIEDLMGGIYGMFKSKGFDITEKDVERARNNNVITENVTYEDVIANDELYNKVFVDKLTREFRDTEKNRTKRWKELTSGGLQYADSANMSRRIIFAEDVEAYSETLNHLMEAIYGEDIPAEDKALMQELSALAAKKYRGMSTEEEDSRYNELLKWAQEAYPSVAVYASTTGTDGFSLSLWTDTLRERLRKGEITKEQYDTIFEKLMMQEEALLEGKPIPKQARLTEDEGRLFVSRKPVYAGFKDEVAGTFSWKRNIYVKTSVMTILPQVAAAYPALRQLYINLAKAETSGIDKDAPFDMRVEKRKEATPVMLSYHSAVKVGAPASRASVGELFNKETDLLPYSMDVSDRFYYVQVENPYARESKGTQKIVRPSQSEKTLLSDGLYNMGAVFPNTFSSLVLKEAGINKKKGELLTGKELARINDYLYEKESKLLIKEMRKRFYLDEKNQSVSGSVRYVEKLHRFLKNEVGDPILETKFEVEYLIGDTWLPASALEKGQKKEAKQARLALPVSFAPGSELLENKLMAFIRKTFLRRSMPGMMFNVTPSAGFENPVEGGIRILSEDFDGRLKPERVVDGEYKPAQVFISGSYRVYDKSTGTYIPISQLDVKEPFTIFSTRIPHSGLMSGQLLEVVGILPDHADTITVPSESLNKIGEDFDNDKRYTFMPVLIYEGKGKFTQVDMDWHNAAIEGLEVLNDVENRLAELQEKYPTAHIEDAFDVYLEFRERGLDAWFEQEGDELMPDDPKEYQEVLSAFASIYEDHTDFFKGSLYDMARRLELDAVYTEVHNMYRSVYASTDSNVQSAILRTVNTDLAKRSAARLRELQQEEGYIPNFSSVVQERQMYKAGKDGKFAIGVHSRGVATNAVLQSSGRELTFGIFDDDRGVFIPYEIKLGKFGKVTLKAGRVRDKHGNLISTFLMESQNVATDHSKDPLMYDRNENEVTIGVFQMMQLNGLEYEDKDSEYSYASFFIAQPILRDYAEKVLHYKAQGLSQQAAEKQAEKDIAEKYKFEDFESTDPNKHTKPALDGSRLTFERLEKEIKDPTYNAQYTVFQTFLTIKAAADKFRFVSDILNRETNGLGKTFSELQSFKYQFLNAVQRQDIQGLGEGFLYDRYFKISQLPIVKTKDGKYMFAHIAEQSEVDSVVDAPTDRMIDAAIASASEAGWYKVGEYLFKASSFIANKVLSALSAADTLFGDMNIYNNKIYQTVLSRAGINEASLDDISTRKLDALKKGFMRHMLSYFGIDDKLYEQLFMETDDNQSLAGYIDKLLSNTSNRFEFIKNSFIGDLLVTEVNESNYPSIIRLRRFPRSMAEKQAIRTFLEDVLYTSLGDTKLPSYNGNEMDLRMLMKYIFAASLFMDNSLHGLFPVAYYRSVGLSNFLHTLDIGLASIVRQSAEAVADLEKFFGSTMDEDGRITNKAGKSIGEVMNKMTMLKNVYGNAIDFHIDKYTGDVIIKKVPEDLQLADEYVTAFMQHNPYYAFRVAAITKQAVYNFEAGGYTYQTTLSDWHDVLKNNSVTLADLNNKTVFDLAFRKGYRFLSISLQGDNFLLFKETAPGYYQAIPTKGTEDFHEYWNPKQESAFTENKLPVSWMSSAKMVLKGAYPQTALAAAYTLFHGDSPYSVIGKLFAEVLKVDNPDIIVFTDLDEKYARHADKHAFYSKQDNTIYVNKSFMDIATPAELVTVLAEEIMHAITVRLFDSYVSTSVRMESGRIKLDVKAKEGVKEVPAAIGRIIKAYEEVINTIVAKKYDGNPEAIYNVMLTQDVKYDPNEGNYLREYRLMNIHEFIAGLLLRDSDVVDFAKGISMRNVDKEVKPIIRRMFGRLYGVSNFDSLLGNIWTDMLSLSERYKAENKDRMRRYLPSSALEAKFNKMDTAFRSIKDKLLIEHPKYGPLALEMDEEGFVVIYGYNPSEIRKSGYTYFWRYYKGIHIDNEDYVNIINEYAVAFEQKINEDVTILDDDAGLIDTTQSSQPDVIRTEEDDDGGAIDLFSPYRIKENEMRRLTEGTDWIPIKDLGIKYTDLDGNEIKVCE